MYKRVLLALNLEGVNNVTGEPYMGLSWDIERRTARQGRTYRGINGQWDRRFDKLSLIL